MASRTRCREHARRDFKRRAEPAKLEQRALLPRRIDQMRTDLIARDFGAGFAEQVAKLPEGVWTGPVASGLGAHLVCVSARTSAALPLLEAVRQRAAREWENERRDRSRSASDRKLSGSYEVAMEPKLPPASAPKPWPACGAGGCWRCRSTARRSPRWRRRYARPACN